MSGLVRAITVARMPAAIPGAMEDVLLNTLREAKQQFLDRDDIRYQLGRDRVTYLKFVPVDQLGLNLRNAMAHGLLGFPSYNERTSVLMIHQMLLLTAYTVTGEDCTE